MIHVKMPHKGLFERFIKLNMSAIEANVFSSEKNKQRIYCHEMFVKFTYHLASIYQLELGTFTLDPKRKKQVYDYSSVNVLSRTLLENFLTAYYVFYRPVNKDESRFHYLNWYIDGFNSRQKTPDPTDPMLLEKKNAEAREIEKLLIELKQTQAFGNLTQKQQDNYLKKTEWIRPGWVEIAKLAGFSDKMARMIYSYLSGYSHNNSNSILQFRTATIGNHGKDANSAMMNQIFMANALNIDHFIKYSKLNILMRENDIEMIQQWLTVAKNA